MLYDDKPGTAPVVFHKSEDEARDGWTERPRAPSMLEVLSIAAEESIKLLNPLTGLDEEPALLLSLQAESIADVEVRNRASTVVRSRASTRMASIASEPSLQQVVYSPFEMPEMVAAGSRRGRCGIAA